MGIALELMLCEDCVCERKVVVEEVRALVKYSKAGNCG